MKDVLEPFSDIGAPATACWCACFNFEDSSRSCDEHKAALVAEVRRLRAEVVTLECERAPQELVDHLAAERDAAHAEAERQRERADYNAAAVNANADEIVRLRAGAARVREALQAIRDLHHEIRTTTGVASVGGLLTQWTKQTCDYCSRTHVGGSEVVGYPCATVRALDAALDGAE